MCCLLPMCIVLYLAPNHPACWRFLKAQGGEALPVVSNSKSSCDSRADCSASSWSLPVRLTAPLGIHKVEKLKMRDYSGRGARQHLEHQQMTPWLKSLISGLGKWICLLSAPVRVARNLSCRFLHRDSWQKPLGGRWEVRPEGMVGRSFRKLSIWLEVLMTRTIDREYKEVTYPQDLQISPDSGNYDVSLAAAVCRFTQAHKAFSIRTSEHR